MLALREYTLKDPQYTERCYMLLFVSCKLYVLFSL